MNYSTLIAFLLKVQTSTAWFRWHEIHKLWTVN